MWAPVLANQGFNGLQRAVICNEVCPPVPTHPCRFLSALQRKWGLHIPKHTLHVTSPSPPLVSAEGRKAGPAVLCSPASAPQLTDARSVTVKTAHHQHPCRRHCCAEVTPSPRKHSPGKSWGRICRQGLKASALNHLCLSPGDSTWPESAL